jgi:hypothetical protein
MTSGTAPTPLPEETYADQEDTEERPALDIPARDRRLVTQPFDFIVGSLEEQISLGQLVLQDDFQRRQVWDPKKSSRLIESLLLNVPIPVCYFAELEDGTYSVIDGQQRLTAVARFISNLYPLSGLRVRPELNKKRFAELEKGDQRLIKTRAIRCIVIQKESHPDIRFDVFERLNQGAVRLNPQELRNSTYRGTLNGLIRELCENATFKRIRRASEIDARMGDAEMVLRFFAFHFAAASYKGLFAPFLDKYLEAGMKLDAHAIDQHRRVFVDTIDKIDAVFGNGAFRQIDENGFAAQVNRAVFDVQMLSFAHIEKTSLLAAKDQIVAGLKELCTKNAEFQDAVGRATRDKARINSRVRLWCEMLKANGIACPDLQYGE